ncbi:glycosyltransferase family 2 protein [Paracidovorax anthurii]|uniref:Dolichol-phosphate mannosyltransferase n=1 Tax=Paracidovorax anthurii TaxID=78229 RepID=A0A328YVV2_9BURK|nr:glycosyltransferase family 2 protein [Paracidovorax anthurii]RAR76965.1 dolichol-phosphate mannosyltransferase [Paracidovorax anthurii]
MMKKIAIVVPVYCEEKNIRNLHRRIVGALEKVQDISVEYIFVNDGSSDRSMEVLRSLAQEHGNIKVIDFSRNFGKEVALTAGVHSSDADAVVCMDADLQHPPELIPTLIETWRGSGADVVATIRTGIDKQPLLRRLGSHGYYWLMSKISGLDMVSQTTDFRLFDRKVVEAFRSVTDQQPMFRGIMDWMGFRKVYVEFHAGAREAGVPGYSYARLLKMAISSITSFSLFPLRLIGYIGVFITLLSGGLLFWMLMSYFLMVQQMYTPLAIVVVANTFFIGLVLMAMGLMSLYIGAIHTEAINRPVYIIRERLNF